MARNEEKAMAVLNRIITAKGDAAKGPEQRRPFIATEVRDVNEAQKWRRQIVRDITREVAAIQNGAQGEHKIRDMNDKINKLLRERTHWERHIKALGGPDFGADGSAGRVNDSDGTRAIGADGYYYFGAARDLPGVQELFARAAPTKKKRTRHDLSRAVNSDYYGYGDEDDGLLCKLEAAAEKRQRSAAVQKWREENRVAGATASGGDASDDAADGAVVYQSHVELPSQEEIERAILQRRKAALIAKLGGAGDGDDGAAASSS